MIKVLPAAAVAAGLIVICSCGQSAPASPSTASPSTARAGTAARLPGLSQDCLTMRLPPPAHHCYTPRVFDTAYGIQPLLDRGINGRGVTVVLPEATATTAQPPEVTDIRQDLADFDSRFGLPPARIQVITTLAGSSASPWLAGAEEVQDTEMVHAVAPDATLRELLVDPADVSTPAKATAAFATYVRIAVRDGTYQLKPTGGTSASGPLWAGLIALADQEAGHSLGFVNPAIYRIARGPLYHKAFHDITTGNNTAISDGVTITGYQAGPGWDPVTGWGTPDAQVLIPLLAR
jgi:subtilase family serine protease